MVEKPECAIGYAHLRTAEELLLRTVAHLEQAMKNGAFAPDALPGAANTLGAVRAKLWEHNAWLIFIQRRKGMIMEWKD